VQPVPLAVVLAQYCSHRCRAPAPEACLCRGRRPRLHAPPTPFSFPLIPCYPRRFSLRSYIDELKQFVAIPSISSDPARLSDLRKAATFLKNRLENLGMQESHIFPTDGTSPIVYAEYILDATSPVVLFYGHYDVAPIGPEELWEHPPFDGIMYGPTIHGRGASKNKGNGLLPAIQAMESIRNTMGSLPYSVKFLIEGEEEMGSPNLGEHC
jgi:acetylornithine deacetylase/succinyl-diaminopimelate desuccinylase-like protein